jgi:hypothetical protein
MFLRPSNAQPSGHSLSAASLAITSLRASMSGEKFK